MDVAGFLLEALALQEYRGYDSAGIAVVDCDGGGVRRLAVSGRVAKLKEAARAGGFGGFGGGTVDAIAAGIGHTRWATHGAPTERNAHPILAGGGAAIVHNGIIENHDELRAELRGRGRRFRTQTDSEVIAHLFAEGLRAGGDSLRAMRSAAGKLRGAFAVAAIARGRGEIVCARRGSPLLVGEGEGTLFVSSDAPALGGAAKRVLHLADGDCALLRAGEKARIVSAGGRRAGRQWRQTGAARAAANLGGYRHFMKKEIAEQPQAAAAAMADFVGRTGGLRTGAFGGELLRAMRDCRSVNIVACGTSYHAAMTARYWVETLAGTPCRANVASEYRYRADPGAGGSLTVAVSQSGETADTIAAAAAAKEKGARLLAIVNESDSTLARDCGRALPMRAGMEVGVASTKAFTAQLTVLLLLALGIAKEKGTLSARVEKGIVASLRRLPELLRGSLLLEGVMRKWAGEIVSCHSGSLVIPAKAGIQTGGGGKGKAGLDSRFRGNDKVFNDGVLFIGRGGHYPLALEGALKLKEISYIHAEGCAAGELKHGTLALVDAHMPAVVLAPGGALAEKTAANAAEIAARGGRLYVLAAENCGARIAARKIARVDDGCEWISPIVFAPPLQLLAYYAAKIRGADIDKPRNLAKSVTVE